MDENLMKAAMAAKENANNAYSSPNPEPVNEEVPVPTFASPMEDDDDEAPVIFGAPTGIPQPVTAVPPVDSTNAAEVVDMSTIVQHSSQNAGLTEEDLRAAMPEVSQEHFDEIKEDIIFQMTQYKKNLIVEYGMTPEEAQEAAVNRMKKDAVKLQKEWLENNPVVATVTIKKDDVKNLYFSPEEKEKLSSVKVIRLEEIEDVALKSLNIIPTTKKLRSDMITRMQGSISQDSVPLYRLCDLVTFSGGQIAELYSLILLNEDDSPYEKLVKKAAFVYDHLLGGAHYKKYDLEGNVIMTYRDFLRTFPWLEMDLALFSILCATTAEETVTMFSCTRCNSPIEKHYKTRDLLTFKDCPDEVKDAIDKIIQHRNDAAYLKNMMNPLVWGAKIIRSPITKNVYEIQYPSLGKALMYIPFLYNDDPSNIRLQAQLDLTFTLNRVLLYNKEKDGYVEYTDSMEKDEKDLKQEEITEFWEVCGKIPQEDIDIIHAITSDPIQRYNPTFEMDIDCTNTNCEHHMHNQFIIDQLLFQKARDSQVKIEVLKN